MDLDKLAEVLYSAVVSDACDQLGLRGQTFEQGLRPLTATGRTIVGWARTAAYAPAPSDWADLPPYGKEISFLDSLRPGDVVIADVVLADVVAAGGSAREAAALWGELFSTAALGRGARGALIGGCVRDLRQVEDLGFPVHGLGTRPSDSLGRLSLSVRDEPLRTFGVSVSMGDFVIADSDGVVVVPRSVAPDVIARAVAKVRTEGEAKRMLLDGARLADVWKRLHVL